MCWPPCSRPFAALLLALSPFFFGCDDATTKRFASSLSASDEHEPLSTPHDSPELLIGTIALHAEIFGAPHRKASIIGTLVAGSVVPRKEKPEGFEGCRDGWYEVSPRGYVCHDHRTTLDAQHPTLKARSMIANRDNMLPYPYAKTRRDTRLYEPDSKRLDGVSAQSKLAKGSYFAVVGSWDTLDEFDQKKRLAMLTTGQFVSVADIEQAQFGKAPSTILGAFSKDLPLAYVTAKDATLKRLLNGSITSLRSLDYGEPLALTGSVKKQGDSRYLVTQGDGLILESKATVIPKRKDFPKFARSNRHLIDLDLARGVVVLYEGERPTYATLALRVPKTKFLPQTTYVQRKLVTLPSTLAPTNAKGSVTLDEAWVIDLVNGLRLQAATTPCDFAEASTENSVELHPDDAHRVFQWLSPEVPERWHGVSASEPSSEGSPILVH